MLRVGLAQACALHLNACPGGIPHKRRGVEAILSEHRLRGEELGFDVLARHEDLFRVHGRVTVGRRDDEAVEHAAKVEIGEHVVYLLHVRFP